MQIRFQNFDGIIWLGRVLHAEWEENMVYF